MTLNNNRPSILLTNINERSALGAWRSIENTNVNVIKATTIKGLQSLDHKKGVLIHPCPINEFNDFKIWIKTQLLKVIVFFYYFFFRNSLLKAIK